MSDKSELRDGASMTTRRRFLGSTAWMVGAIATGAGSWVIRPAWGATPIKVGIATDLTGAIGYAGNANANTAKLVMKECNGKGGILGRPIELYVEDTASNESTAVANVRKLIQRDKVDVVFGGITSSMRNAIKDVIVTRGRTLYVYPQLYEGKECTPYIFCTGPTPAQQCDEFIPWLMKNGGKRFALPSANYVWPHVLNQYARKVIEGNGGEVIFEEYYPLDQVEYSATVNKIMTNKVDVVFNTVIPPGGRWRRRSITPGSPRDRAARQRWCRASATARCECTPPWPSRAHTRSSPGARGWSIPRSAERRRRDASGQRWARGRHGRGPRGTRSPVEPVAGDDRRRPRGPPARGLCTAAAGSTRLLDHLRDSRADPRASGAQLRPRLGFRRHHELRAGAVFRGGRLHRCAARP